MKFLSESDRKRTWIEFEMSDKEKKKDKKMDPQTKLKESDKTQQELRDDPDEIHGE